MLTNFHGNAAKKKKLQKSFQNGRLKKNGVFQPLSKAEQFPPKYHGLVLRLVELIDAKGIDVAQPIWLRDHLT
jgi:hypothetical protein